MTPPHPDESGSTDETGLRADRWSYSRDGAAEDGKMGEFSTWRYTVETWDPYKRLGSVVFYSLRPAVRYALEQSRTPHRSVWLDSRARTLAGYRDGCRVWR